MDLKNCCQCGKAYVGSHPSFCPDCMEMLEDEFSLVRNFIKKNPKIAIEVVSEATGVSEDRIRDFLRMGRLDVADLTGPILECKRCGKPVYQGEYCLICQGELSGTYKSSSPDGKSGKKSKSGSFTKRYQERKSHIK